MEYVVKIIADVLAALYQTAGASLLLAALVMCVYMLGRKQEPVQWFGHGSVSFAQAAGSGNIFSWYFM